MAGLGCVTREGFSEEVTKHPERGDGRTKVLKQEHGGGGHEQSEGGGNCHLHGCGHHWVKFQPGFGGLLQ